MYSTIIFDSSEILIAGFVGIENEFSTILGIHKDKILEEIYSPAIHEFFRGKITEQFYLYRLIKLNTWSRIAPDEQKVIVRMNFSKRKPGMKRIIRRLSRHCELV
jgi:hypothetical protein